MKKLLNIVGALIVSIWFISCQGKHEHSEAEGGKATTYTCPMHPQIIAEEPGQCPICAMDLVPVSQMEGQDGEIMLSENQIKLANITTQEVNTQEIGKSTFLTGKLAVNEENIEVVSSRVGGRIEKLYVKEVGQRVRNGQALYELYSEQLLTLQNEFLLASRQTKEFKDNERYASFLKSSEKKLLLFGMTKSQIAALTKIQKVEPRITFLATSSGIVSEIAVAEGQYVAEGNVVYRLEKLDKIWVEAELYPGEAALVKQGDKVKVIVTGFENDPVPGEVTFISPEFKQGTQVTILRVEIANPEGRYLPGMQADVVLSNSNKKSIAIPTDAVIRDEKSSHVWVQKTDSTFQSRMVKTGLESFDQVEILEGLRENEKVVVTGAYLLYSEYVLKKGGDPMQGHSHSEMNIGSASDEVKQSPTNQIFGKDELNKKSFTVSARFREQLKEVLDNYYEIKEALVASNSLDASEASKLTKQAVEKTDMTLLKGEAHELWMKVLEEIDKELLEINSTKDLEKQRVAFDNLTGTLYQSLKTFGVSEAEIYYQYCPMAFSNQGGYWLSKQKEIENPFFGEKMLSCGETKEVLQKTKS